MNIRRVARHAKNFHAIAIAGTLVTVVAGFVFESKFKWIDLLLPLVYIFIGSSYGLLTTYDSISEKWSRRKDEQR